MILLIINVHIRILVQGPSLLPACSLIILIQVIGTYMQRTIVKYARFNLQPTKTRTIINWLKCHKALCCSWCKRLTQNLLSKKVYKAVVFMKIQEPACFFQEQLQTFSEKAKAGLTRADSFAFWKFQEEWAWKPGLLYCKYFLGKL